MAGVSAAATVDDESDGVVHRNPIWNYFLKIPPGTSARCIKCKAILKTPTGTTTLVSHLKRHPDAYQAYMEERQARKNTAKLQSPTASSNMTKMIANFIACGMHPYSVVEEGGFVDMSKKKEVKRKLQEIFSRGAECYSLTTDGWTSRANDSYVCLTVHVMDKDIGQHVHALACTEMGNSHTADNLVRFIESVIEEWELPASGNLPIYVITDNGRNFTSAVARSPWCGMQCFQHTLQLCVSDAKKEVAGFSELCAKARAIVGRYKRSAKARGRLMEIQKNMQLDPLEVVQDVPTRWNSEHAMMARLVKLRVPVTVELSECETVENPNSSEWKLISRAVKVLQPLEQATTDLSGDSYPTLSQVIPLLHCTRLVLTQHSTDEAASLASSLLRSIGARFPDLKMSRLPALAMLVDPRFKDICYIEKSEKK
ncbi:hypothetical protein HPB47_025999 [Ixodes persulcatus]|uniref:Uncharacterized protein n=1 Tax=Ixodes persulcatus TaxID=34615 RepID=A0AC60PZX0_IXOPE|nr:hypothetical protein HPB47_025999 [Ixodes persulcatus]